jgi:hypothetical protein
MTRKKFLFNFPPGSNSSPFPERFYVDSFYGVYPAMAPPEPSPESLSLVPPPSSPYPPSSSTPYFSQPQPPSPVPLSFPNSAPAAYPPSSSTPYFSHPQSPQPLSPLPSPSSPPLAPTYGTQLPPTTQVEFRPYTEQRKGRKKR